ncbi:hypothetical protein Tco_1477359, partial [Tanacetum coccineum]
GSEETASVYASGMYVGFVTAYHQPLDRWLPCDGIDMVIKDLDFEPKTDAMMRDFWSKSLKRVHASERDSP